MDGFYRKIYINIFLTLFFLLGFIVFAMISLNKIVEEQNELVSGHAEELILAQKLHYEISMQFAAMPIYVLSGDDEILKSFENNRKDFILILAKLKNMTNDPQEIKLLDSIFLAENNMHEEGLKGIAMSKSGVSPQKVNQYFKNLKVLHTDKSLPDLLESLVSTSTRDFENAKKEDAVLSRKIIVFLAIASVICIAFAGMITALFIKVVREKKRAEEKDAFISNARKDIVDTVSHDLKNPLSSIRLGLQYVERKIAKNPCPEDYEVSKGLTIIFRSVDKMEKLISDLLDHTKLEAGKLVLEPVECDLAKFMKEVIEQFRSIAQSKNIQMTFDLDDCGKTINCDQGRVEQVISNIIGNALKFTPNGGQIHIMMKYEGENAVISIHDTGYGMNHDQLEHVFDRYWQVKDTASQGTGLGLAIAKIVVETHHGKIWAESEPGKGSTFHFSLPAETHKTSYLH
jgi:signal transduction histidine kinase